MELSLSFPCEVITILILKNQGVTMHMEYCYPGKLNQALVLTFPWSSIR